MEKGLMDLQNLNLQQFNLESFNLSQFNLQNLNLQHIPFNFIVYCVFMISLFVLIVLIFSACSPLTSIKHEMQTAYTPHYNTFDSPIAEPYIKEIQSGKDGALIIADGTSALLHRLAFIQMAQSSIDIQTYIYKNELTSKLLIHELLKAASRGVKIRILIDDNGVSSDVYDLVQLDNHANIEVRIFNPYFFRFGILRAFEAPFDFNRINKRMHNKLFIFDESALIMGGRNIGDEYFDNANVNFTDMDLLFVGNISKDSKKNFEEFWNYDRSIPLSYFPSKWKIKRYEKKSLKEQAKAYNIDEKQWLEYLADIESFKEKYINKELKMSFGQGVFLADLPSKVDSNNADSKTLILDALSYNLNYAKDSIIISSSYLVPGDASLDMLQDFLNRGIKIQILTNSLASIDVVPVYSHWEKYRDRLAKMGVEVYEYTSFLPDSNKKAKLKDKAKFYNTKKGRVSLHSKSMIIDSSIIAVGSFNLDYRSAMLNTESIVFFKSDELAGELKKIIQEQMAQSYRVLYDKRKKRVYWERDDLDSDSVESSGVESGASIGVESSAVRHAEPSEMSRNNDLSRSQSENSRHAEPLGQASNVSDLNDRAKTDSIESKNIESNKNTTKEIFTKPPNTSFWLRLYKNMTKIIPEKLF